MAAADFFASDSVVTTTEDLDKICIQVGVEDLQRMLRAVAATAIQEQIGLGNPPTNIIVDNSGQKAIDTAERRVQAFFTDTAQVRAAVYDAWERIQTLTRVASGQAQFSYQLWFGDRPIGRSPAACEIYLDRLNDPKTDYFRIVGPVVPYGRVLYWNPVGKPRFNRRVALRTKSAVFKVKRIQGIMKLVAVALKRKYRGVAIGESWVTTSTLPKDGRTPGLYIGFRKKGAV